MIDPWDVTAVVITRGDLPNLMVERTAQFERLGMDYIIYNSPDILTRYLVANRNVTTKAVFFQDDDVDLSDEEILGILSKYEPAMLVSNMYDSWIEAMQYFDLALVGLGAVCDVGLWNDAFSRYVKAYGEDDGLLWDADFIFGALCKWRRYDFCGERIVDAITPEASNANRLWKQEGQHERKYATITKARALRKVCLTMMSKDEEENIHRALASSAPWWDSLLLLDTGSTDHTIDIARAFCEAEGKQFHLVEQEFTNFAEMRQWMISLGRLYGDYMLLQDADELWQDVPERPELWAEAYMLHYDGTVDYAQPRLIASRFPWKWSGPVHSYLDSDWEGECLAVNMQAPRIVHLGDTRHGTEKVERDIEILLDEIKRTSDDLPRNLFLLGKAYDGIGQHEMAIHYYELRVGLHSNDEEDYWCRLRLGNLYGEHLNDFARSVETLWAAYKSRPQRVEALRALAFYCTAVADATPYPEEDIVMVLRDHYRVT